MKVGKRGLPSSSKETCQSSVDSVSLYVPFAPTRRPFQKQTIPGAPVLYFPAPKSDIKTALTLGFIPSRCPKGDVVQDDVGLLKRRAADRGILWSGVGRRRRDPWQVKLTGGQRSGKHSRETGGAARVGEQRISMCILPYFTDTACVNIHLKY